jgi:GTP-binding protein Era
MVAHARSALADVDAVLVVLDSSKTPDSNDEALARILTSTGTRSAPVILALNKMDLLRAEHVERHVGLYTKLFATERYMLTTASRGHNLDRLLEMLVAEMPEREPIFPADEFTDQSSRFVCAELIREQVLAATRQELPYAAAVHIEEWAERPDGLLEICASIFVERASQRPILIGKQGQTIKKIGTQARAEIEAVLGRHVHLDLHVVVRENWRMSPQVLRDLEYAD